MQARERIIRDRFAEQACARCGTPFPPESVLVLARRRTRWLVMVSCPTCQHRNLFVVSFPQSRTTDVSHSPLAAQAAPSPLTPTRDDPVTFADVYSMREFLASFSGDFRSLFASPHPAPRDDSSPL
jgi:DNA-directed RNA polymerase subunit RPC12/RpoP